ncbi:MAG TPA: CBS domain-containing protein [Candidatus Sulfotelmatobacter sp.]|nr:CBS domain-containing protein [Candidatus Sulfotelmatobacter sp.]
MASTTQTRFQEGFVSELVGRPAVVERPDGTRQQVGRVADFVVQHPDDTFPKVDAIAIKTRAGMRLAPVGSVAAIEPDRTVVLTAAPTEPAPPDDQALYLVEDLFDKQIVDVDGRKVVRINDLELARTADAIRVVAADIGVAGLLRRLGGQRIAARLMDRIPRSLIAWDNVAPLHDLNPEQVRLSVSQSRLGRIQPADLAEIISELSARDAARVVGSLDDEHAADALEHLDPDVQRAVIDDLGTERAADIIEEMDSDDAADLLGELPEDKQNALLAEMEPETAEELRELAKFAEDTAGGLMTTDYVWIYPHRTVDATIAKIREIGPETEFVYYLYVTDQARTLLGALSLRTLLLSKPDDPIHAVMEADLVSVSTDTPAEDVASTIARYDLLAVPVVSTDGKLLGIVTVDDAIDAIIPERLKRKLPRFTRHHRPAQKAG